MTCRIAAAVVVAGATSCAVAPKPGSKASDWWNQAPLTAQVQFDHGCPAEKIRLIRYQDPAMDLDVCGAVRRYKSFQGGRNGVLTLVDVTALYPASALPAPLPPDASAPAPRPRPPQ